jgi:hypothetical protein
VENELPSEKKGFKVKDHFGKGTNYHALMIDICQPIDLILQVSDNKMQWQVS